MADGAMRERLGRIAHDAWAAWADEQPKPWPIRRMTWEDSTPVTQESFRRMGEAVAAFVAEHCAQAILRHSDKHEPPPGSTGYLAWHRHFGIATRVAAGAFMTGDDIKRAAAEALARGDFVACPSLESGGGDA